MQKVTASQAFFIKLGRQGKWEEECIREGRLRVSYRDIPHELCAAGRWSEVTALYRRNGVDQATRYTNELRRFYEAGPDTLWVTFSGRLLWWAFADGLITADAEGYRYRAVMNGWRSTNVAGAQLGMEKLSSRLTQVTGFRGTICQIREPDYLLRKINGQVMPEVEKARETRAALVAAMIPLIARLTWKDFELLVDLVFTAAGWRRIGVLGKTEKHIDLDMIQPVTQERVMVQVKAKVTPDVIRAVSEAGAAMEQYDRVYLVTHTPVGEEPDNLDEKFEVFDVERLALLVLDAGLTDWLIEKSE